MENFFGLLKTEMSYKHEFKSTEHLISEIESYTDDYKKSRIKCKLKGLSPVQYRIQSSRVAYLNCPNWKAVQNKIRPPFLYLEPIKLSFTKIPFL